MDRKTRIYYEFTMRVFNLNNIHETNTNIQSDVYREYILCTLIFDTIRHIIFPK